MGPCARGANAARRRVCVMGAQAGAAARAPLPAQIWQRAKGDVPKEVARAHGVWTKGRGAGVRTQGLRLPACALGKHDSCERVVTLPPLLPLASPMCLEALQDPGKQARQARVAGVTGRGHQACVGACLRGTGHSGAVQQPRGGPPSCMGRQCLPGQQLR